MSRPRSRIRALAFAVALGVLASLTIAAPPASAAVANFNCTLLAPNTWCRHSQWHNYNGQAVSYPGTGTIPVCTRMVRRQGGGVYSSACGTNAVSNSFARCNCGGLWHDIRHSGPNARNLNGTGTY